MERFDCCSLVGLIYHRVSRYSVCSPHRDALWITKFGVCLFWHPVRPLLYLDYFLNYGWELIYAFHSSRDYALNLGLLLVLFVYIDIALFLAPCWCFWSLKWFWRYLFIALLLQFWMYIRVIFRVVLFCRLLAVYCVKLIGRGSGTTTRLTADPWLACPLSILDS